MLIKYTARELQRLRSSSLVTAPSPTARQIIEHCLRVEALRTSRLTSDGRYRRPCPPVLPADSSPPTETAADAAVRELSKLACIKSDADDDSTIVRSQCVEAEFEAMGRNRGHSKTQSENRNPRTAGDIAPDALMMDGQIEANNPSSSTRRQTQQTAPKRLPVFMPPVATGDELGSAQDNQTANRENESPFVSAARQLHPTLADVPSSLTAPYLETGNGLIEHVSSQMEYYRLSPEEIRLLETFRQNGGFAAAPAFQKQTSEQQQSSRPLADRITYPAGHPLADAPVTRVPVDQSRYQMMSSNDARNHAPERAHQSRGRAGNASKSPERNYQSHYDPASSDRSSERSQPFRRREPRTTPIHPVREMADRSGLLDSSAFTAEMLERGVDLAAALEIPPKNELGRYDLPPAKHVQPSKPSVQKANAGFTAAGASVKTAGAAAVNTQIPTGPGAMQHKTTQQQSLKSKGTNPLPQPLQSEPPVLRPGLGSSRYSDIQPRGPAASTGMPGKQLDPKKPAAPLRALNDQVPQGEQQLRFSFGDDIPNFRIKNSDFHKPALKMVAAVTEAPAEPAPEKSKVINGKGHSHKGSADEITASFASLEIKSPVKPTEHASGLLTGDTVNSPVSPVKSSTVSNATRVVDLLGEDNDAPFISMPALSFTALATPVTKASSPTVTETENAVASEAHAMVFGEKDLVSKAKETSDESAKEEPLFLRYAYRSELGVWPVSDENLITWSQSFQETMDLSQHGVSLNDVEAISFCRCPSAIQARCGILAAEEKVPLLPFFHRILKNKWPTSDEELVAFSTQAVEQINAVEDASACDLEGYESYAFCDCDMSKTIRSRGMLPSASCVQAYPANVNNLVLTNSVFDEDGPGLEKHECANFQSNAEGSRPAVKYSGLLSQISSSAAHYTLEHRRLWGGK